MKDEIDGLQFQMPGFDLAQVENIVDNVEQRVAGFDDHLQILALLRGQIALQENFGHADHTVHGGADLVAHVRQKLAFGQGGHLRLQGHLVGPVDGVLQLPVGLLQLHGALFDAILQRRIELSNLVFDPLVFGNVPKAHHDAGRPAVPAAVDAGAGPHGEGFAVLFQQAGLHTLVAAAPAQQVREDGLDFTAILPGNDIDLLVDNLLGRPAEHSGKGPD